MLHIWYGRENRNKDQFLFDRIGETLKTVGRPGAPERILLLVPDQYTLQAEQNAFHYLKVRGFMDLEIMSLTGLGRKVATELGGQEPNFINQYGKHMLIARLLHRNRSKLTAFRNLESSTEFTAKLSDMISELKNDLIGPEQLTDVAEAMEEDSLLKRKLADVAIIYGGYEERIRGRYTDTADHLLLLAGRIGDSAFIRNAQIWMAGFDYFSPAARDVLLNMAAHGKDLHVLLTAEPGNPFFALTNRLAEDLLLNAEERGIGGGNASIPEAYGVARPPEIVHIEKALFTWPQEIGTCQSTGALRLSMAANYYSEAETAAASILELVRDRGYRFRDILVLCNDMSGRGPVIDRVFSRYGLPVFMDRRRGAFHNPVPEYILALLDIVAGGRRYEDVFRLLKTDLTPVPRKDWEELENYVIRYRIRRGGWDQPFPPGDPEYEGDALEALNQSRQRVADLMAAFERDLKKGTTAGERTEALRRFLQEEAKLPETVEKMREALEADGRLTYAAEMAGIWDVTLEILDQMRAVLGDLPISATEFATVLRTGFESIRIGILPPSPDQILLGSMLRTRSGDVKAVFVLGANDGVLPAWGREETVFSEEERTRLAGAGCTLGRNEEQILLEEQMAIYRNLSRPERLLSISCAASDESGREIRPSLIFQRLRRLFPDLPVEKDLASRQEDPLQLIQSREETIGYLTEALRKWFQGQLMPEVWTDVFRWYRKHSPERADRALAGLTFRNRAEMITPAASAKGEQEPILTSPSALERYGRCPFSWFVDRAVGLRERRIHEMDHRFMGDLYHEVLMRYGMALSKDGKNALDADSPWQIITKEDSAGLTDRLFEQAAAAYGEGLLSGGDYEDYRKNRLRRVTREVAWALTEQVRTGRIEDMRFESSFDADGNFPPVEVVHEGKTMRIRGKIDRLDILEGGYARVIDYKSGAEAFSMEDVLAGWQMQLLIYLKAVSPIFPPAGVFYFRIAEPHVEDTGKNNIPMEIMKKFRLDGVSVADPAIESVIGQGGKPMEPADFEAMQNTVSDLIQDLCGRMASGDIAARPMTAKNIKGADNRPLKACTWCHYRSVCSYDALFD